MKQIFILAVTVCLVACNFKRTEKITAAYSTLPTFNLLSLDSTTILNTKQIKGGRPILFMYVTPDCEHCQQQIKNLLKNINSFKNIQIYIFTPASLNELRIFCNIHRFKNYRNINIAKDYEFAFYRIFNVTVFPYTVIYDRHKKLVKLYKGEVEINNLLKSVSI